MNDPWQIVGTVLTTGILVKLGDMLIRWMVERAKLQRDSIAQDHKHQLQVDAQEFTQAETLFAAAMGRIEVLEKKDQDCTNRVAALSESVGYLKGRLEEQSAHLLLLQKNSTEQGKQIIDTAKEIADSAIRLHADQHPAPLSTTDPDLPSIHDS